MRAFSVFVALLLLGTAWVGLAQKETGPENLVRGRDGPLLGYTEDGVRVRLTRGLSRGMSLE